MVGTHKRTPCTQEVPIEAEQIALSLASAALEKKARNVELLDMRNLIDYADVFVLCSATNRRQVQAIADEVRRCAKHEMQIPINGIEGYEGSRWVLVDVGSVIVHVFDEPLRGFYNLDGLWRDAPRIPLPEECTQEPPNALL